MSRSAQIGKHGSTPYKWHERLDGSMIYVINSLILDLPCRTMEKIDHIYKALEQILFFTTIVGI
jgi:hypothetical protein